MIRRRFAGAAVASDLLAAASASATMLLFVGEVRSPASVVLAIGGWIAIAGLLGLYSWRPSGGVAEAEKLIAATSVGTIFVVLATGAAGGPILVAWLAALAWSGTLRWMRRNALRRVRARGDLLRRTLLIVADGVPDRLSFSLQDDDGHPLTAPAGKDGLSLVGAVDDLPRLLERLNVERVAVPAGSLRADLLVRVLDIARRAGVEATIPTSVPEMRPSRLSVEHTHSGMSLTLHPATLSRWQSALKRALDLSIAIPALLLSLPFMLIIAVVIRIDSAGPVLFIQERATKGGRPFRMLKFRTMVTDAEARAGGDINRPFFKIHGDPRVTRVGRVLRRTSLDEIPQLWNVVRGEMSLVGPRPLPIGQVRENWGLLGPRHEVRAGITGWWQVNGRDDSDLERSLAQDVYYIRNWSIVLDLFVIARTLGALFDRRGSV